MNLLKEDFVSLIETDCFILATISNKSFKAFNIMKKTGNNSQPKHSNY